MVRRSLIVTLAAGALISSAYAPAFAVDSEILETQARVEVGSIISLTGLSPDFTLTGLPGEPATPATVEYTVRTNNAAGYIVTVSPQTASLTGSLGNDDVIPIELLQAGDDTVGPSPLQFGAQTTVHTSTTRTPDTGDLLGTTFSMDLIPFVNSDTYVATLDYVATTL